MSIASIAGSDAAAARQMIETARKVIAPNGWRLTWRVEMINTAGGPTHGEAVGWSDFDNLEDAVENFRTLRRGPYRVPARIVAQVEGPIAGMA